MYFVFLKIHCVKFLRFSEENILWLFKNRSRRARVDQNDITCVFCMKKNFFFILFFFLGGGGGGGRGGGYYTLSYKLDEFIS